MTTFVTVQASGAMTRLRRYEARSGRKPRRTHEGLYDPDSVDHFGVIAYVNTGASQDRVRPAQSHDAAARRPA